jgi:hypothetical protein
VRWAGHVARVEMHTRFLWRNLKDRITWKIYTQMGG